MPPNRCPRRELGAPCEPDKRGNCQFCMREIARGPEPACYSLDVRQWRAVALDERARAERPDGFAAPFDPPRSPALLLQACERISELERKWWSESDYPARGDLPQPSPDDCKRWRDAAASLPGPLGRCIQILVAAVQRLGAEGERQRELLRRVRCYAVVDPLGNPGAITLPSAARMFGIERDIDDYLEGRPPRARPLDVFSGHVREQKAPDDDDDPSDE